MPDIHQKAFAAPIPGDIPDVRFIHRAIRVNQAGEYGAKRIYDGQLAVLKDAPSGEVIAHMAEQEQVHLDTFNRMMVERGVRPTLLQPLWHMGAFALGAGTALLGEKAAMACTVAVETVIADHYQHQLDRLDHMKEEAPLREAVYQFREEEIEHHDTGLAHDAEEAPAYPVLSAGIRGLTRAAIWISERV